METVNNRVKPNIELSLSRELKATFRFLHETRYLCKLSRTMLGRKRELQRKPLCTAAPGGAIHRHSVTMAAIINDSSPRIKLPF